MLEVLIDGRTALVSPGTTILEAAARLGIRIPTLCYHPGLPAVGSCRLCMVEIVRGGSHRLVTACMYPITEPGLMVLTDTERVKQARRFILGLLLQRSPAVPLLQELAREYGVERDPRFTLPEDLCIRCGRCVRACEETGNRAISFAWRGWEREVSPPFGEPPAACTGCGACAEVCPTGAISLEDRDGVRHLWGRRFPLVACRECGEYFATAEQLAALAAQGELVEEELCPRCRRRKQGEKFLLSR